MEVALRRRASGFLCRSCTRQFQRQSRRNYSKNAAPKPDIYDVVCVGGGPAGLSLLTALRANPVTSGLRVALIEAQDLSKTKTWKQPPDKFSNRCSSITPASARFLENIGAWTHVQQERVEPYQEMQVWDGVTGARVQFDWAPGYPAPAGNTIAYEVENLNLTSGLLKRMDELGGVSVFDNARVERIALGAETEELDLSAWPVVHLTGDRQLHARLLVGADGINSSVRAFADIETRGWDYDCHCVVGTLELAEDDVWGRSPNRTAYQRFLPTGPAATIPLPGNYASLAWSTTPANAALLKSLSPRDFVAMVNAAFRLSPADLAYLHTLKSGQSEEVSWRLNHASQADAAVIPQLVAGVQEGTVAAFPLRMRHADTYIGERVALVGDAAHAIHPLAGQGLNQGQGDVESLAKTIEYAVSHGQDFGTRMALEPYVAERYAANHVLLGACDKFYKLFTVESGPLVPLRSLATIAVNNIGPLKQLFMNQAAGFGIKL